MSRFTLLAAAALFSLPACRSSDALDPYFAEEALDSTDTAEIEASLLVALADPVRTATSADEAAATAAVALGDLLLPSSCVVAEQQGTAVLYTLTDCAGPAGVAGISGSLEVTFSMPRDTLEATFTGSGVTARGATLDFQGHISIFASEVNGIRTLAGGTTGTATGRHGGALELSRSYTVSWEALAECLTIEGGGTTRADDRNWQTDVTGYKRCKGECPAAGGKIEYSGGQRDVTITISFDGDATASWSSTRDTSGTLDLLCGG